MKALYLFIIILFSINLKAQNELRINEVSSRNDQAIFDEDGDDSDWIELFNTGTDTIQLQNYYLSDDKDEPFMWHFPQKKLLPGEYLVVFASGKNRTQTVNHWETPLNGDSLWKYKNPSEELEYDYLYWSDPNYNDEDWEWKRGAFGNGYENIETESSDILRSIFLRNEFYLSDTSQVMAMCLHAYFDDGFNVFLNGYEIHREHMLHNGIKPRYNMTAFPAHLSNIDNGNPPERFDIEPLLWKNLLKNGRNVIAIQNHNFWNQYPLVIKPWISIAMADSNLQTQVFASELSTPSIPLHTNFKINADGENIYLFNQDGKQIQKLKVPLLKADITYGYHPAFSDSLVLFDHATPGWENSEISYTTYITDTCKMITPSGFYQDSVYVELINNDTAYRAFFSLGGGIPDTNSFAYNSPFWIDSTVVLRIQFYSDSLLPGPVSNYSWFVNDSSALPVFSLITDSANLWDDETGIYVKGNHYWQQPPFYEANFWQNWERDIHIQQFNRNKQFLWEQDAGIKIHGNFTRQLPQKSLGFYAKSKYGNNQFEHPFFNQKSYIKNYKRFLLRNAGNDNLLAHMRDFLIHQRMFQTHLDVQVGYPVNAYLNGVYWGIYFFREKIDRYYLEQNKGINPNNVNLLEQNGLIIDGDRNDFENLISFIKNHDLNNDANYQYIFNKIDIDNWIDLYIANLYHYNNDWPHHNSKFWSPPDGKWHQILVDLDVSMGINNQTKASENPLPNIHDDSLSYLALFYQSLMNNNQFKRHYINRFADLMNTIFLPDEYLAIFDSLKTEMQPDMLRHCERWNMNYYNWANGYYTQYIIDFIEDRIPYMRQFLRERYKLGTYDTIYLSVEPEGKGLIKLNTIKIDENNWSGLYFDSIPVRIEAIPNPGFEFVRWESESSPELADSGRILDNYYLKSNDDIKAVFYSDIGIEDTLQIAITEINYREWENAESGNWIEIYNRENDTIDLSHWQMRGLKPYKNWDFPENTFIAPKSYLILAEDTTAFKKWHPNISFTGPFGFKLDTEYPEQISLYDDLERLVCELSFYKDFPWPVNINTAKTIELINISDDFHLAENWQLGCPGGSPGLPPQNCQYTIPLVITEINYASHPDYQSGDWFEVFNNSPDSIHLGHWMIQDDNPGNRKILPMNLLIKPMEFMIFLQNDSNFFHIYDTLGSWYGPFDFGLSSNGDNIEFLNPFAQSIINLNYKDEQPWPEEAGNNGQSIELINTELNMYQGENWISNCFLGTPWNTMDWCIQAPSIWITEIKYQSAPDSISGDWIEIYNSNNRAIDLKGWKCIVHGDTLSIDDSYQIAAQDYALLISDSLEFYSVYDTSIRSIEIGPFDLKKDEDAIAVLDPYQFPGQILNYHYLLNWPVIQNDTNNRTLELVDYSNTYFAENWRAGCDFGTPGLPPSYCNTDGIQEIKDNLSFTVIPNPTTQNIQIEFSVKETGDYEIKIIDYQGNTIIRKINTFSSGRQYTIPVELQRLNSGIYLLQINGSQQSGQTKIIKIEQ